MKAILINTTEKKVTLVDYDGELQSMYKLIGCNTIECPILYPNQDALYCDENGWIDAPDKETLTGYQIENWNYAILGNSLIVGIDDEGDSTNVRNADPKYWEDQIEWKDNDQMAYQGEAMGLL